MFLVTSHMYACYLVRQINMLQFLFRIKSHYILQISFAKCNSKMMDFTQRIVNDEKAIQSDEIKVTTMFTTTYGTILFSVQ